MLQINAFVVSVRVFIIHIKMVTSTGIWITLVVVLHCNYLNVQKHQGVMSLTITITKLNHQLSKIINFAVFFLHMLGCGNIKLLQQKIKYILQQLRLCKTKDSMGLHHYYKISSNLILHLISTSNLEDNSPLRYQMINLFSTCLQY